jgi:uncharacterized protein YecE (DUF72 family)
VRLRSGTSGFSYPAWKGPFYPEKLPPRDMLGWYAGRLPTVEINNTFYRLPRASVLEGWATRVPADFRFALKASRRITHQARLRDAGESLDYLLRTAAALGEKLGPLLFQLPPFLRKDLPRLRAFLASVPGEYRVALEFRHPSWFDDEVYEALGEAGAALCAVDTGGEGSEAPLQPTAGFGYCRLRAPDYTDAELARWAETLSAQPWNEAYVFFKHEEQGAAPRLASRLLELWDTGARRGPRRAARRAPAPHRVATRDAEEEGGGGA